MLVLTRKRGQAILIGDDIRVVILGDHRIGIEAPDDVLIMREEAADRLEHERDLLTESRERSADTAYRMAEARKLK